MTVIVVVFLAAIAGPKGPGLFRTRAARSQPRPDWPFWWLFALLSLTPPGAETFIILAMPVVLFGICCWCRSCPIGRTGARRRPMAVLSLS